MSEKIDEELLRILRLFKLREAIEIATDIEGFYEYDSPVGALNPTTADSVEELYKQVNEKINEAFNKYGMKTNTQDQEEFALKHPYVHVHLFVLETCDGEIDHFTCACQQTIDKPCSYKEDLQHLKPDFQPLGCAYHPRNCELCDKTYSKRLATCSKPRNVSFEMWYHLSTCLEVSEAKTIKVNNIEKEVNEYHKTFSEDNNE